MLCVALPTDQPCRRQGRGKVSHDQIGSVLPKAVLALHAWALIHDVPDGPVGFTKSTSAQHRRRVTVDPALVLCSANLSVSL